MLTTFTVLEPVAVLPPESVAVNVTVYEPVTSVLTPEESIVTGTEPSVSSNALAPGSTYGPEVISTSSGLSPSKVITGGVVSAGAESNSAP